ncbi:hypothetical protein P7D22_16645 [Lichenihabitans sp. Uapishka_5]|uniref:hypothetical protein n=1 Tax=Lichenihabitans sp. Uapishka_5 TaxID=3037302 RepID=UPI0029E7FE89|nr:hypothetical protein [Lichenihabitans sp. Uapishka_5]MDX7952798.1 hypothetical protein [Lichenihabitans sp. Uapishka_5]
MPGLHRLAVAAALLAASAGSAAAACHDALMPFSSLQFRRNLQPDLRDLGITGFGRTQPYRDSTISVFMSSEVTLVIREQDDLAVEIGAEVPLPAEPVELAKFNALVSHVASRLSGDPEPPLRATLLASILAHATPGQWQQTSGPVVIGYSRAPDALIAKLHLQKCE